MRQLRQIRGNQGPTGLEDHATNAAKTVDADLGCLKWCVQRTRQAKHVAEHLSNIHHVIVQNLNPLVSYVCCSKGAMMLSEDQNFVYKEGA